MAEEEPHKSWWSTLPGLLTGLGTFIAAVASLVAVINNLPSRSTGCDKILLDTGNTLQCDTTETAVFDLQTEVKVNTISVWYNTQIGGLSLPFKLQGIQGQELTLAGIFQAKGCDPKQNQWCEGQFTINSTLKPGRYKLITSVPALCQNSDSHDSGFIKVKGCPN